MPVVWSPPIIGDGKYQHIQNFEPNAFYFNIVYYVPTTFIIEINSSTASTTRTGYTTAYWLMSQQFICPKDVVIFAKCYDANNNHIISLNYRNGQSYSDVNIIEAQMQYLGGVNVQ